jgi:general stress protein CsbA
MSIDIVTLQPWIALIFGVLILAVPQILNYLVAGYLILIGVAGLMARYGVQPV